MGVVLLASTLDSDINALVINAQQISKQVTINEDA